MVLRFLSALTLIHLCLSLTVDNGLVGDPVVECGSESLTVHFGTQKAFEGHVYVKGHYSNNDCKSNATLMESVDLTVPFTQCDVLRQRSNNPRGLMITSTVIISFHPMFITKIDKSYKLQCFYSEVVKTVTNQLDVSVGKDMEKAVMVVVGDESPNNQQHPLARDSIGGTDAVKEESLTINAPLPECQYEVLAENSKGEQVKFATVGQQVYHKWSCNDTGNEDLFCATVHSCNVREEGGKEVQLLDENGCAVDKFLLNNLEYTSDLAGGQISQVFKFADQPSLFFSCQIRLSYKEDGQCIRSSDHCPAAFRGKRSASLDNEVDVFSQHMTVFDIDDPITSHVAKELGQRSEEVHEICISPAAAFIMLVLLASLLLVSLISLGLLCFRPRTVMIKLQD